MERPRRATPTRRQLLLGGAAVALGAACSPGPDPVRRPGSGRRTPPRTPAETVVPPAGPRADNVSDLWRRELFHVAHRGSGDNWTEHSTDAYVAAWAAGADAVEISVNATSDGVLLCHHDPSTLRLTGVDRVIADSTWADLQSLRLDAREWLGPQAPSLRLSTLEEALAALDERALVFVEDKQGTNTVALLDLMDAQPRSVERFVWKQWADASQSAAARERGYQVWGYLDETMFSRLDDLTPRFDALGVHVSATDEQIELACATGLPVIGYEVHNWSTRSRLLGLGVRGMMCSNILYLLREPTAAAVADTFASGLRAAGDLPDVPDLGWGPQPRIDASEATLVMEDAGSASYSLGSMSPVAADSYAFTSMLRWPSGVPEPREHAGVSFCLSSDAPYVVGKTAQAAGYHAVIRIDGSLEVFERSVGDVAGTLVGAVETRAVQPGEWITLVVEVTPSLITVTRQGGPGWSSVSQGRTHHGAHLGLNKSYATTLPVEFSQVRVTAV